MSAANIIKAFVAGALGVVLFQLSLSAILSLTGVTSSPLWPMNPVPPFGIPQTVSWAFWGGLWGIVLLAVLRQAGPGTGYWLTALLFGGIVVSAVLLFVVFPIKGRPLAAGWNLRSWIIIFALHAAFGLGTAVFLRLLGATRT